MLECTRAPVVENRKVIGIVGYTDIVLTGVRDKLLGQQATGADPE